MDLTTLLSELRQLRHEDKLSAVQFLIKEIAKEENTLLAPDPEFNWSQYDAEDAAQVLWEALQADKQRKHD